MEINDILLYHGDSFKIMRDFEDECIDLIITDPPYFLSNNGISCSGGKMVSVNKGSWDKEINMDDFYYNFLIEAKRILKPNGTIWVFGSMHNIYTLGYLLKKMEFRILNNVTWEKTNPPPNLSCKMFTHSTETILWASKSKNSKYTFNYVEMKEENNGKQMKDVWRYSTTKASEKKFGKHPTQKPLELIKRIIKSSSKKGDLILDCFMGSGTTGVASIELERKFIGIELEEEYYVLANKRINEVLKNKQIELF